MKKNNLYEKGKHGPNKFYQNPCTRLIGGIRNYMIIDNMVDEIQNR